MFSIYNQSTTKHMHLLTQKKKEILGTPPELWSLVTLDAQNAKLIIETISSEGLFLVKF